MLPSENWFVQTTLWISLQKQPFIGHLVWLGVPVAESCRRSTLNGWRFIVVVVYAIFLERVSALVVAHNAIRRRLPALSENGSTKFVLYSFLIVLCVCLFVFVVRWGLFWWGLYIGDENMRLGFGVWMRMLLVWPKLTTEKMMNRKERCR